MTNLTHATASATLRELSAAELLAVSGGASFNGQPLGPRNRVPSSTYGVPVAPPLNTWSPPSGPPQMPVTLPY